MTKMITFPNTCENKMRIDPEVAASDLVKSWKNGNKKSVIDALKNDHPGLTALFFYVA